jgi:3-hydroxyisobutyrate dehydrogenase
MCSCAQTAPASRGYTGGFGSALMQKDLGLAADAAKSVNAPLPLGSAAHALYSLLTSHGNGGRDFSVMYEFFAAAAKK